MKRKIVCAAFGIFTLCLIGISTATITSEKEKNISDSRYSAVGYKYTIREYNGNVAVFSFGSTYPLEVLECPLKSLPDNEAQRLSAGIDIETEEELQKLIEAYD